MVSGRKENGKDSNIKLVIILIVLVLIIIGLAIGIVLVWNNGNNDEPSDDGNIDYSMTTEEEKAEFDGEPSFYCGKEIT